MKYPDKIQIKTKQKTNNKNKHKQINKQTEKQENRIKKHNNNNNSKYTNLHTIKSKLFSLTYFTQKTLSGYCSDDIYKKGLHPLLSWHHN